MVLAADHSNVKVRFIYCVQRVGREFFGIWPNIKLSMPTDEY